MKLAIVYFNTAKMPEDRKHHQVYDFMLQTWAATYRASGTTLEPILLIDKQTQVPSIWPYGSIVIENPDPPEIRDVLNKVGWIKGQAFEAVGRCVVMDLDAFIVKNVNELAELNCPIGMVKDFGVEQIWSEALPEVGIKHNAGVIVLNENPWLEFQQLWQKHWSKHNKVTYFDELLFSIMLHKQGRSLPGIYNRAMQEKDAIEEILRSEAKIIHYPGRRKHMMKDLMRQYIL
jgi:hypothetical protein